MIIVKLTQNHICVVSLHQPRSDIYLHKIDNLLVLAKGGRTVYSGPRNQVEASLKDAGHPIPTHYNPADWLLDLVSVDPRGQKREQSGERVKRMIEFWADVEKKTGGCESPTGQGSSTEHTEEVGRKETSRMTPAYIAIPIVVERMLRNLCVPFYYYGILYVSHYTGESFRCSWRQQEGNLMRLHDLNRRLLT